MNKNSIQVETKFRLKAGNSLLLSPNTFSKGGTLRVTENGILRLILGANMEENVEWRRLHSEELHSLYRSSNIVRVIKSRRLR